MYEKQDDMSHDVKNHESLWDFSCAFYARPSVAAYCLQLQDQYGIQVNVLLWCLWLEKRAVLLTEPMLSRAIATIDPWHKNYVLALRKIRRQIKLEVERDQGALRPLKQTISEAELLAEKLVLTELEIFSNDFISSQNKPDLGVNLVCYLQFMNTPQAQIDAAYSAFGLNLAAPYK
jgi:uncharacterized protein (TIGR02444 family)